MQLRSLRLTQNGVGHFLTTLVYNIDCHTHLKMVFGKVQKQFCPSKVLGAFCPSKVLGAFCPGKVLGVFQSGDNCNQDLFFEKTKNQIGFSIIASGSLESPSKYIIKYLTSSNKSCILPKVESELKFKVN